MDLVIEEGVKTREWAAVFSGGEARVRDVFSMRQNCERQSCRATVKKIGVRPSHETGRWLNNRLENSHLPFRRRTLAMLRLLRMRSVNKFFPFHCTVQIILRRNAISTRAILQSDLHHAFRPVTAVLLGLNSRSPLKAMLIQTLPTSSKT